MGKKINKGDAIGKGTKTYKNLGDPKIDDRETDAYYKIESKLPESKVSIPTEDAVIEAKEWVDDVNKM